MKHPDDQDLVEVQPVVPRSDRELQRPELPQSLLCGLQARFQFQRLPEIGNRTLFVAEPRASVGATRIASP
ncbi:MULTISPECIES: hypothetical protein [unclassified Bradyrhizobium]|uniref:hypothetical protein n=1 Tax=unclassified Bradyrhizobium TaxID=2631580 RepID=UPI0005637C24|nr:MULTISPECIES: hypothetical protein [Bradyrhizobium]UFW38736.1 hypothetical protein BcanWSM471_21125 [Bradyrhizobium canariense]